MNEEEIRNLMKNKLQNLSKEQLIDTLVDICMTSPAIRMMLVINNTSTDLRNIIGDKQRVNAQFAPLQQSLGELTKGQKE